MTGCSYCRYLLPNGDAGSVQLARQAFTSWEAIHSALRQAFGDDGYMAGTAITCFAPADGTVTVAVEGGEALTADLLVCADGANSWSRRHLLPEVEARSGGHILAYFIPGDGADPTARGV